MTYTIWKVLTRRKVLDAQATQETPLARVLNTFDLTALGVGSTLGVGVYVLAGEVARNTAGPAVTISFLIAAIASVFAGLCYAEFGARTPRAGSAYIYSYLCVGEFIAFVIGWNLILEYIIGSASVAKGLSSYIDNLTNGTLNRTFTEIAPINIPFLSPYFDFLAFTVPVILSLALAFGMKESSLVNNVFTTLNVSVVLFVIIAGSFQAHLSNWFINPNNVTNGTNIGKGGFFPFGFEGVLKGAATCFYGFVGFDCIATTGEEAKNPKKSIPIAIIVSLFIIFLAYFGTSCVLTLMVPYYEQDTTAPIPFAFQYVHWYTAALVVTIGAMFGLYASLFGAMFPLPRILYAMASDGLIFKFMGRVNERFKTPVIGTLFAGLFTGLMAALFQLQSLVNMMSIGTLLAYTIVAACVLLLRYSVDEKDSYAPIAGSSDSEEIDGYTESPHNADNYEENDGEILTSANEEEKGIVRHVFNFEKLQLPTVITQRIVSFDICLYCVLCFLFGLCALHLKHEIVNLEILPLVGVSVILLFMGLTMLSIITQPMSRKELTFQVPWVPLIPALSIFFNIYLMIMLDIATWVRFVVWMILGCPIFYFARRKILKEQKYQNQEICEEGRRNDGFHSDNLTNSYDGEIITTEDNIQSVGDKNVSGFLTPNQVIETLDLVIDSYVVLDHPASPMLSVEDVPSALNVSHYSEYLNNEYCDTLNTAMRKQLLKEIEMQNSVLPEDLTRSESTNEDILHEKLPKFDPEILPNPNKINLTEKSELSDSDSEKSYVSALSNADTGQEELNFDTQPDKFEPPSPPPPPPPILPPPPPILPPQIHNIKVFSPSEIHPSFRESNMETKIKKAGAKATGSPMIINKNSLSSVKLRHVERPSLEMKVKDSDNSKNEEKNSKVNQYSRSKSMNYEERTKGELYGSKENTLPRIDISKTALNSVKLRHIERPSLSLSVDPESELPDSVQFGTPEFKEFKNKLNEKLMNPAKILRAPSFVDPKLIPKKSDYKINTEDIIDDSIDRKKARETIASEINNKLNILRETPNPDSISTEE